MFFIQDLKKAFDAHYWEKHRADLGADNRWCFAEMMDKVMRWDDDRWDYLPEDAQQQLISHAQAKAPPPEAQAASQAMCIVALFCLTVLSRCS